MVLTMGSTLVVTIVLTDFLRARQDNPLVPKDATAILSTQAVHRCLNMGYDAKADFYHLFVDRNERYGGHMLDRMQNKRARRHLQEHLLIMDRIDITLAGDMRLMPALQMADLFAWCVSHKNKKPQHAWQREMLKYKWADEWLEYDTLIKILPGVPELVESWNLPARKPTR